MVTRVVFAGLLILAPPRNAAAQQSRPAPVSPVEIERREEARRHFERGVELAGESRWQDAIREFEAARDLRATAAVYNNLGLAYRAVGRNGDAIRALRDYLRIAGNEIEPARVHQVTEYIRELSATIGRLRIDLEPATATLTLDGAAAPGDSVWRDVDPGRHVIAAEAAGFRGATRRVEVSPGGTVEIDMHLAQQSNAARLQIESNVSTATIRLDGQLLGIGSADEYVPPGVYRIDVTAPHRGSFQRQVTLLTGTSAHIRAALSEPGVASSPWFWAGTVGAVAVTAALVVGGVFLFSSVEPIRNTGLEPAVCIGSGCPH